MAYAPAPPRSMSFMHSKALGDGGAPYWSDMGHGVSAMGPVGPMASMVAVSPAPSSLTPPRSEEDYYHQPQPYVHVHAHVHAHLHEPGAELGAHGQHGQHPQHAQHAQHAPLFAQPVFNEGYEGLGGPVGPVGHAGPGLSLGGLAGLGLKGPPVIRVVRRRNTANKKERRRTQSINNAYADLRDCIPNVPVDTKLSKIKTLRLAASYIAYLAGILESGDPCAAGHGFRAELMTQAGGRRPSKRAGDPVGSTSECGADGAKSKGRTGWPEHVWALELKQEQF